MYHCHQEAAEHMQMGMLGNLYIEGSNINLENFQVVSPNGVGVAYVNSTGGSVQNRIKETLSLEEKARNDFDSARRAVASSASCATCRTPPAPSRSRRSCRPRWSA